VHLTVLAVGKLRPTFREAVDDYLRRLGRYARVSEIEVREEGRAGTAVVARRREGERLRRHLPSNGYLVALDREGRAYSSAQLARRLAAWLVMSRPVVILIGGPEGLDSALKGACHEHWSLGPLTLPHELARVVACEQLYRAWTIHRGEPYHK
jgi:23S rRNA (pseudouridine1915-N3)-methyltransferase